MKSGICPKCGSNNIYADPGNHMGNETNQIGITTFTSYTVDHYICTDCRYIEKYVGDQWDLDKIKKKWKKQ